MCNAVFVNTDVIEARFTLGLPAQGRRAAGREAVAMLVDELPQVINTALYYQNFDSKHVWQHVHNVEDQDALRLWLQDRGWSLLSLTVHCYRAPASLARTVTLPNIGEVRGIVHGVTLIVGGGFHGKSTLLHAVERGVYNHVLLVMAASVWRRWKVW